MKLEYLLNNESFDEVKNLIDEIEGKKVQVSSLSRGSGRIKVITVETEGDNLKCAETLSLIDGGIQKKHSLTLIRDDASAHFEQLLFPRICRFERELRRYLTALAVFSGEEKVTGKRNNKIRVEKVSEIVSNIEQLNLGEVQSYFFSSIEFNKSVEELCKRNYTKKRLLEEINKLDDSCFWNKHITDDNLLIVKEKYEEIVKYRNDVMHSHRMSFDDYEKASLLLEDVNERMRKAYEWILFCNDKSSIKGIIAAGNAIVGIFDVIEKTRAMWNEDAFNGFASFVNVLHSPYDPENAKN